MPKMMAIPWKRPPGPLYLVNLGGEKGGALRALRRARRQKLWVSLKGGRDQGEAELVTPTPQKYGEKQMRFCIYNTEYKVWHTVDANKYSPRD